MGVGGGKCLHDGEDDVGSVLDGFKGDGGDHDDHEVKSPVGGGGEGVGWCTNAEWHLSFTG